MAVVNQPTVEGICVCYVSGFVEPHCATFKYKTGYSPVLATHPNLNQMPNILEQLKQEAVRHAADLQIISNEFRLHCFAEVMTQSFIWVAEIE